MTDTTSSGKSPKKQQAHRLGRGLSSLLGEPPIQVSNTGESQTADSVTNDANNSSRNIMSLPIEWIVPGPWQPRRNFDSDELKELAVSIKSRGLLQPVIVRPHPNRNSQFQLIAGERRWRASQMAALHEIPAIISNFEDKEAAELSLIENIQRRDLSVIEEAEGYQVLLEKHGYSQQELADIVGKSRSHIANIGRLLSLPQGIRDKIIKRILTMGQVRPLIGREDAEQLVEIIISDNLSARDVEALIKSQSRSKTASPQQEKSSDIKALEIRARTELGLFMRLDWDEKNDRGQVAVKVTSLEQLEDLLYKIGLRQAK
jgi:ParB family chromosome partitioning protein